jgi:hypothetical protein
VQLYERCKKRHLMKIPKTTPERFPAAFLNAASLVWGESVLPKPADSNPPFMTDQIMRKLLPKPPTMADADS